MFHQIFKNDASFGHGAKQSSEHDIEIDFKIFKVFRDEFKNEHLFDSGKTNNMIKKKKKKTDLGVSQESHGYVYSIRDLVKKPASFFVDKFFFIDCPRTSKKKF